MAFTSLFLDTSVGSTMTGMGDYISDLSKTIGVDLFEEDIDNVVFQTNEFLCNADFIGSQGPFWWLLVVTAFLPILSIVTRLFSITSNFCLSPIFLRRDKNGTKPENIISKNTFEPIKSFAEHCFAAAKVLFCPVKNEGKSINLLFCGVFVDLCGTKDNTIAIFNRFF